MDGLAAAPAPPTPLEQRQWRRTAQTAVRVALTTTKAARSRSNDASAAGTSALTDLTNLLLESAYLPARPLGVLSDTPGLVEAAASKLRVRQREALVQLEESWEQLDAAAKVGGRWLRCGCSVLGVCCFCREMVLCVCCVVACLQPFANASPSLTTLSQTQNNRTSDKPPSACLQD